LYKELDAPSEVLNIKLSVFNDFQTAEAAVLYYPAQDKHKGTQNYEKYQERQSLLGINCNFQKKIRQNFGSWTSCTYYITKIASHFFNIFEMLYMSIEDTYIF
jgi:hypothetical protein